MRRLAVLLVVVTFLSATLWADVVLPSVFSPHMVLQRDLPLPVWGTAAAGEQVTVELDVVPPLSAQATAGQDGRWRVDLPAQPAGGPYTLRVKGANEVVIDDVLIGEVWLCSGQSNMEWTVARSLNFDQEKAAATDAQIRCFTAAKATSGYSGVPVKGSWAVCSPETVGNFTACGYFMARDLRRDLNVPIGLLNSSWGGTRIEPWCTPESFALLPELADINQRVRAADPKSAEYQAALAKYLAELADWTLVAQRSLTGGTPLAPPPVYPVSAASLASGDSPHQQPTTLWHGMVEGHAPYAMRGAIWYQGESNHGETTTYTAKMEALIRGWRTAFENPNLAFNYVQIAPYNYGNEAVNILPNFWAAQADALRVPHTGMVVTNDIATYDDIHPPNKQEVGRRLALLALRDTYGRPETVAEGPTFKSMAIEGNAIRIAFDNVGSGLDSRDGQPLNWFRIIGEGTDFVDASAVIDGSTVLVSSPEVAKPLAVWFAQNKAAEPNLQNKEGLPARPFKAGDVPKRDYLALRVPEAATFDLAYDLDLAKLSKVPTYDVDRHTELTGTVRRLGYFLELTGGDDQTSYVWVSMDPFTTDLAKIAIPTVANGALFQQPVGNVNIISNVTGVAQGTGLTGCHIEFWPNNYAPANSKGVPGASNDLYDFGDQPTEPSDGHGCMQVNNAEAKQTVFAINAFRSGDNAEIGIGNSTADPKTRDWTFVQTGQNYTVKRLRVLVQRTP